MTTFIRSTTSVASKAKTEEEFFVSLGWTRASSAQISRTSGPSCWSDSPPQSQNAPQPPQWKAGGSGNKMPARQRMQGSAELRVLLLDGHTGHAYAVAAFTRNQH